MYKNNENLGHTYWQWFTGITVNICLLTYGMQAGWVSPYIKTFQSESSPTGYALSDSEISWVGSVLGLAATVAVPLYSYLADAHGRKICIFAIAIAQAACWLIKLLSANTVAIITARVFAGISGGGCFIVIPMYVKEICQDNIRGILGSLLIMFQNIGYFVIYFIGAYWDYHTVLWIVTGVPIVNIILIAITPESPAYLIKKGNVEKATDAIAFLQGLDKHDNSVQREIAILKKEDQCANSTINPSLLSIFKNKAWRKIFIRMICLCTIQSFNGSLTLMTYGPTILASSGASENAELQILSFPLVSFLIAFVSMFSVERFGRKPVLIVSLFLCCGSMVTLASMILYQKQGGVVSPWFPLPIIIICVAGYYFGLAPVPYIMMSEVFNFQIRSKASGLLVTYGWFMNFAQLFVMIPLSKAVGMDGTFFFFSAINIVGLVMTIVLLPETRAKTVEQLEIKMRSK